MRLTTKIFIGSLFFVLSLVLMFFVYLKVSGDGANRQLDLSDEMQTIDIPSFKAIKFEKIGEIAEANKMYLWMNGEINISNNQYEKNGMSINKQLVPYLQTELKEDTLIVKFDGQKMVKELMPNVKQNKREGMTIGLPVNSVRINLAVHSALEFVSRIDGLALHVNSVDLVELNALMYGSIQINDSKIEKLTTKLDQQRWASYVSKRNTIGTYNLHLNRISNLQIDSCAVEQMNVYGGNENKDYTIANQGIKSLNWYPNDSSQQKLLIEIRDSNVLKFSE